MWNNERLLAAALIVVGLVGAAAAWSVPFTEEFTLGPGAMPMIYAVGLVACAAALAWKPGAANVGSFVDLRTAPGRDGLLLFLFAVAFAIGVDLVGFALALFLFSLAVLLVIRKWSVPRALAFSALWAAGLYAVFVRLLGVPLAQGWLFG